MSHDDTPAGYARSSSAGDADLSARSSPRLGWDVGRGFGNAQELYRWVEESAAEAYNWYIHEKIGKARVSKLIRVLAVTVLTAGAVLPLLSLISDDRIRSEWGFVALACGGGLLLLDRAFGFSSSWARYATAAMELRAVMMKAQLTWAKRCAIMTHGSPETEEVEFIAAFDDILDFADAVSRIVMNETVQWSADFDENLAELRASLGGQPK